MEKSAVELALAWERTQIKSYKENVKKKVNRLDF